MNSIQTPPARGRGDRSLIIGSLRFMETIDMHVLDSWLPYP